jgi:hypothetical protein
MPPSPTLLSRPPSGWVEVPGYCKFELPRILKPASNACTRLLGEQIQDLLHLEATDLKLEVTMLLDTTATVLADAYKNRTGEVSRPLAVGRRRL